VAAYDIKSLHEFLTHTPEAGLRGMLIDKKNITDVHFNLLVKVARATSGEKFTEHFEKKDFPKLKMGPAEIKIREKFWDACTATLLERGLLQPAVATKNAPPPLSLPKAA
jgi:hypothetical protein